MKTIGYHVLEDRGNPGDVTKNGPFTEEGKTYFLGKGYYFWDNNIEQAEWWGERRCSKGIKGRYIICEADLELTGPTFLDLVGNMNNINYFRSLIQKLNKHNWPIGTFITYLQELENQPKFRGIFPFEVIRAVDLYKTAVKSKFVERLPNYTNLNPCFVICLVKKSSIVLRNFKIIYPAHYVQ